MELVPTTPLAVIFCALVLWLGPVRGAWCVLATLPLGGSAAVILNGLGALTLTDTAIVTLWLGLWAHGGSLSGVLAQARPGLPGFPLLLVLGLAALGMGILPRVFAGRTEVFVVARTLADGAGSGVMLAPLQPFGSNLGQMARLGIDISGFAVMAAAFARHGDLRAACRAVTCGLIVATLVHAAVSLADLAAYHAGHPDLLDWMRTVQMEFLDHQTMFGLKRLVGNFPEPSSFAQFTAGLFGIWLYLACAPAPEPGMGSGVWRSEPLLSGPVRAGLAVLVTALMLRSTSSLAYAVLLLFAPACLLLCAALRAARGGTFGGTSGGGGLGLGGAIALACLPALAGGVLLAWVQMPLLGDLLEATLLGKSESYSGLQRMSWNRQALDNLIETWGLGAGIGSVRASGWGFAVLGNLGLPGAVLLGWFLWALLWPARSRTASAACTPQGARARHLAAALRAGLICLLLGAGLVASFPNLQAPFFLLAGIACGLDQRARCAMRETAGVCPPMITQHGQRKKLMLSFQPHAGASPARPAGPETIHVSHH